jgi:hypothetical protein
MANGVASFSGIPADIILRVCEAIMAKTPPGGGQWVEMAQGVKLSLALMRKTDVDIERYMLLGQDWVAGFNLSLAPKDTTKNVYEVFGSHYLLSAPGVENQDGFVRDMVLMKMTHSDWRDEIFD